MWISWRNSLCVLGLVLLYSGCSSPSTRFGSDIDVSDKSEASGFAYGADDFSFRKNEPIHPATKDIFYYKTCNAVDSKVFYSRTSYDCTEP
jgi:hypothetical protein